VERDRYRAAVYAAEDQLRSTLDRGGRVDFFGSILDVPAQRRFADLASVQNYVDAVLNLPSIATTYPLHDGGVGSLAVRERAGSRRAHYEPGDPGVIAIPLAGLADERWAARESVVLHEVAHHLTWPAVAAAHDHIFCGCLVHLYSQAMSPAAALLLRAALDSAGVPVAEPEVIP